MEQTLSGSSSSLGIDSSGHLIFSLPGSDAWRSTSTWIILRYYDRQHPRPEQMAIRANGGSSTRAGLAMYGGSADVQVEKVSESEIALKANIPVIGIGFTARIILRDDGRGFSVVVRDEDIVETNPSLYRILSLEILPEFGFARSGESGYLTLPNWIGTQCFFDKSYPRELSQTIYSINYEWENVCNLGVFGITRDAGTLCGIVAKGDANARLISRVHWEENCSNSTHPELLYRWQQEDERIPGDREVRYSFATPDDEAGEGYAFCGKQYRQFMRSERGLLSWDQKAKTRPEAADYLSRFFLKIFMAYKDPQPDGHGQYHAACTFAEARQMIEACLAQGMKKLAIMLVGWNIDGHDGMVPTRFPIDERLGGEAAFKSLIAFCRENDVMLGVHDYYGAAYSCSPDFDVNDLIRHRTGEYWESVVWSGGQAHNICPSVYVEKHVKRYMPMLSDLGLHGHEHIDAIGCSMPCFSKDHPLNDRSQMFAKVSEMFRLADEIFGSVSTEYPYGPYLAEVDGVYHSYDHPSAHHLASDVGRYFYDRSVPLLSVVVHGSVNCGCRVGPAADNLINMLAFGLHPQSEAAKENSGAFGIPADDAILPDIKVAYDLFYAAGGIVERIGDATIESLREPAPGVYDALYSSGDRLRVNTTAEDFDDLPANSWRFA
jgi:hypothetical protein